jgi:integrase
VSSAWVRPRPTSDGGKRYRVEYRLGGRESRIRYSGSFRTRKLALQRKAWVIGELVAQRVPDLQALAEDKQVSVVTEAADRWFETRIDVAETTKDAARRRDQADQPRPRQPRSRGRDGLGGRRIRRGSRDRGLRRSTIRKTLQTLQMIFDHAEVNPNPARDKRVRLPREDAEEMNPPTAEHVATVFRQLPAKHRLAYLFLDWSGARVSAIDTTLVSDYDRKRRRVRLRAATTKTRRALWIELHPVLADALEATLPSMRSTEGLHLVGDRDPDARLFAESGADALRTSIAKACRAKDVPLFSPHDLRHRRISLLHLRGVPWARIGEFVGQRSLSVTADTYTHVLADETEVDYEVLLAEGA